MLTCSEDPSHGGAGADDLAHPRSAVGFEGFDPGIHPLKLEHHLALRYRLLDFCPQLLVVVTLGQKIEGAYLHRFNRGFNAAVGGGDDDDDVRPPIHDVPQKLEPIHFRHPQIGDKNIRAL